MTATAARQLDEITVTAPVAGQLLSGYPTEVAPGTYPVLHDPHLRPTDDDLVCIDILPARGRRTTKSTNCPSSSASATTARPGWRCSTSVRCSPAWPTTTRPSAEEPR